MKKTRTVDSKPLEEAEIRPISRQRGIAKAAHYSSTPRPHVQRAAEIDTLGHSSVPLARALLTHHARRPGLTLSSTNQLPPAVRLTRAPRALVRLKIGAFASIAICLMAVGLTFLGLLPLFEVGVVTAYCIAGNSIFYWLIQSGRAAHFRDPSCVFAHHLFIISILLLGCALIPQDRSASLQLFLLICAFDMPLLSRRQLTAGALMAIVGVLVILLVNHPPGRGDDSLQDNLLALSMTVVYVPVLVAVSHAVRKIRQRQIAQREALADALSQLQILSKRDVLTGASNRRHALDMLAKEVARQDRNGRAFSVALLDLDFFKRINDSHGHAIGDEVLIRTAQRLGETLPPPFTVARWGGEEFLVVMPETSSTTAADWMRNARAQLASQDWSGMASGLRVDASVGVCEHRPGETTEATLERADRALYQAKAEGRGRVVEQSD